MYTVYTYKCVVLANPTNDTRLTGIEAKDSQSHIFISTHDSVRSIECAAIYALTVALNTAQVASYAWLT
jgi:hypothetical protein